MAQTTGLEPAALLLLALGLAVLPFVAIVVTSYSKIVIVLGLLRQALGVQQVPPNMVLNGAAIILSCYIMAPVLMEAGDSIERSTRAGRGGPSTVEQMLDAAAAVKEPFRNFLKKHASEREVEFFLRSATQIWSPEHAARLTKDDLIVLAPAFLLSELAAAFRIGFLLYLAFIVVDLVIANVLLAMGLSQVAPANVAIPFKLLLFIALDGWSRLVHGLVLTYR
jgi:type III secretion protein R